MAVIHRWPAGEGLEEFFVRHYPQLVGWARQLVGADPSAAEDLVQDTFVRLALRQPDLGAIVNLEGYLFITMRNVHLSEVRRHEIRRLDIKSLLDYESLMESLAASTTERLRQTAYEELVQIARYASIRKATSKAASALILRFFHGYYPAEIARVLQTNDAAVDARLRIARAEAHAFLTEPDRLRSFHQSMRPNFVLDNETDFVAGLRASIFEARSGTCLAPRDLRRLYRRVADDPVDAETLAHLVSCPTCLDVLNAQLGLPLLADRDPSNMTGRGPRNGGRSGPTSAGNGRLRAALKTRLTNSLGDRPKELRIAVNGLFVGSQMVVSGGVSEQVLKILIPERVGFVEVFSEHGTCLLYLDIAAPPDGPVEQAVDLSLSDGRQLSATLTFHDTAPVLRIVYEDRQPCARPVLALETREEVRPSDRPSFWQRLLGRPALRRWPISVALGAGMVSAVIWGIAMWYSPKVSASELLRTTSLAESQLVPGMAIHRVLTVEDRLLPGRTVVKRQRVEVWRDQTRGISVRRLFDDRGQLVAGVWSRPDGTQTTYRIGEIPAVQATGQSSPRPTLEDVWRHEPSAADFTALAGDVDQAVVEERKGEYVLTARPASVADTGVVEVSLTVSRTDHRAIAETIVLRQAAEEHEVVFSETGLEHVPEKRVAPSTYEPDSLLLGALPAPMTMPPRALPVLPSVALPPRPAIPLDALELDVTYRLYRVRVWIGQGADIAQTADGILVTALAPTEQRKSTIDRVFEDRDPAVAVEVRVADPLPPQARETMGPPDLRTAPVYGMLQSSFGGLSGAARDDSINAFRTIVMEYVARRQERVEALTTLIDRWPDDRLRRLELGSVVTWQSMVQAHAEAVRQLTELLRVQIAHVMGTTAPRPSESAGQDSPSSVSAAANLVSVIGALVDEQNSMLRAAFNPCEGGPCTAAFDVDRLMNSFAAIEAAASGFERFYLKLARDEPSKPERSEEGERVR